MIVSHLAVTGHTRGAVYSAMGIATGAAIWSSAAALGIKAIFDAFPAFRLTLQIIGACYLLYIAFRLWRSASGSLIAVKTPSVTRAFNLGLLTNLSNPKAALFFGGIFSTSLSYTSQHGLLISAVVMVVLNSFLWHVMLAYLFSRERLQIIYARKKLLLSRIASVVVGAFGLKLLFAAAREVKS